MVPPVPPARWVCECRSVRTTSMPQGPRSHSTHLLHWQIAESVREGGREREREGGREGGREVGRERGREGGREGGIHKTDREQILIRPLITYVNSQMTVHVVYFSWKLTYIQCMCPYIHVQYYVEASSLIS